MVDQGKINQNIALHIQPYKIIVIPLLHVTEIILYFVKKNTISVDDIMKSYVKCTN